MEEAFHAGWDAPPLFSYVACSICPGVCVVMGAGHTKAHALWAQEGRPAEFTLEKCATDDDFDDPGRIEKARTSMEIMDRIFSKFVERRDNQKPN